MPIASLPSSLAMSMCRKDAFKYKYRESIMFGCAKLSNENFATVYQPLTGDFQSPGLQPTSSFRIFSRSV